MARVLLTAFEPFGGWVQNSSGLCLAALAKRRDLPIVPTTRIYPVDFAGGRIAVERDLQQGYDFVLHLGQHEMSSDVRLERLARNLGSAREGQGEATLALNGPSEIRTTLPLQRWNRLLRKKGVPSLVSSDAGCFVCNAVFYWSLYYIQRFGLATQSAFIHLPLADTQALDRLEHLPSLETEVCADAVEIIIRDLAFSSVKHSAQLSRV